MHHVFDASSLPYKVWKMPFWMRHWGSESPKRTVLWSNSLLVRGFATPKLAPKDKKDCIRLCDQYQDGSGRKRFKGNPNLRKSQSPTQCSDHKLQFTAYLIQCSDYPPSRVSSMSHGAKAVSTQIC